MRWVKGRSLLLYTCLLEEVLSMILKNSKASNSYSSSRGLPLPRLPRLRVVPFLGLAVVHRPGALDVAWSTWSRNDFHRRWTVRGEADSWVHGHNPVFFVICQVSRFVRPVGLQIFQDEESFHSAGRENGPSVLRNGLYIFKTHQTGNYFQISFFHFKILNCINLYAWTICWILY